MRTYDLTPFYRSTVGFDRFFSLLDQATADGSPGYPPYNIERTGENAYRISVAVSGFSQGELSIVAKENTLTIKGEKTANENGKDNSEVLYRGIAARAFERVFQLADFVQVKNASLENGLLHVDLVREIPEAKKPRSIPIDSGAKAPQVVDARREGRRVTRSGFRPILAECENAPGNRGVFSFVRSPDRAQRNPGPLLAERVARISLRSIRATHSLQPLRRRHILGRCNRRGGLGLEPTGCHRGGRLRLGRLSAGVAARLAAPAGPVPAQAWRRAGWPSASAPCGSRHGPAVAVAARPRT